VSFNKRLGKTFNKHLRKTYNKRLEIHLENVYTKTFKTSRKKRLGNVWKKRLAKRLEKNV